MKNNLRKLYADSRNCKSLKETLKQAMQHKTCTHPSINALAEITQVKSYYKQAHLFKRNRFRFTCFLAIV